MLTINYPSCWRSLLVAPAQKDPQLNSPVMNSGSQLFKRPVFPLGGIMHRTKFIRETVYLLLLPNVALSLGYWNACVYWLNRRLQFRIGFKCWQLSDCLPKDRFTATLCQYVSGISKRLQGSRCITTVPTSAFQHLNRKVLQVIQDTVCWILFLNFDTRSVLYFTSVNVYCLIQDTNIKGSFKISQFTVK